PPLRVRRLGDPPRRRAGGPDGARRCAGAGPRRRPRRPPGDCPCPPRRPRLGTGRGGRDRLPPGLRLSPGARRGEGHGRVPPARRPPGGLMLAAIAAKLEAGRRLEREEGRWLLTDAPLLALGQLAQAVRHRLHPEPIVTYVIDTNPNYTNVC